MDIFLRNRNFSIVLLGAILFVPFLGNVHLFDWDEINFAECAREMMLTGDYLRAYMDFQPFWEKPPLFFWMQIASMKIFGINEFAARFPNAICGMVTLLTVFAIGKKLFGERFGMLWVLAFAGSLFPNMYFKSGIIDPWFNLFIFLSLYFFILYHWKRNAYDIQLNKSKLLYALISGVFMGLAILTKGPVAFLIFALTAGAYFVYNRFKFYFSITHVIVFLISAFIVTLFWYGIETIRNGPWFITEFVVYQIRLFSTHDAGQEGFLGYHFVVILIGCFPSSVLAIPSFFKNEVTGKFEKDFKIWMLILFWVVLILFSIVHTKIIHYSSMAWFPVTFMGAYFIHNLLENRLKWKMYLSLVVGTIGYFIAFLFIAFPFLAINIKQLIPYVKDRFAQGNMEANVNWTGFECLIGVFLATLVFFSLKWFKEGKSVQAAIALFSGTGLTIFFAAALIAPKIERYSQGAAIDFYKSKVGEDCYVQVLGFKSYAHIFYTQKQKPDNLNSFDNEWLLNGAIDKPAYFVSKIDRPEDYENKANLKELYKKNGFVFLKRDKPELPALINSPSF
ncbi:MAG: glycosyltransferase family 39 protein [Opitutaceae bacterium]|nr:glycosyltransferase family 39 protein [Cytophagales bacterium]